MGAAVWTLALYLEQPLAKMGMQKLLDRLHRPRAEQMAAEAEWNTRQSRAHFADEGWEQPCPRPSPQPPPLRPGDVDDSEDDCEDGSAARVANMQPLPAGEAPAPAPRLLPLPEPLPRPWPALHISQGFIALFSPSTSPAALAEAPPAPATAQAATPAAAPAAAPATPAMAQPTEDGLQA